MRERRLLEELLRTCKKNTEKKRATKEPPAAILVGRASPKKAMQVVIQGEIRPGTKVMMTFVPTAVSDPPGRKNDVSAFSFTVEPRKFCGVSTYRVFT